MKRIFVSGIILTGQFLPSLAVFLSTSTAPVCNMTTPHVMKSGVDFSFEAPVGGILHIQPHRMDIAVNFIL